MYAGVIISLNEDIENSIKEVKDLGIKSFQLNSWDQSILNEINPGYLKNIVEKHQMVISAFWCGWSGPAIWDFYNGPLTLGLVPVEYREKRTDEIIRGAQYANELNIKHIITHVGFIPEDPNSSTYKELVILIKRIAEILDKNRQWFLFETGQETPATLIRMIGDVGMKNLGVNFDPANLIMYGKANPADAVDLLGQYIKGVHIKDGSYPVDGKNLGIEKPLGEGKVNIKEILNKLKLFGYDGALTIEREISGDEKVNDILKAKNIIDDILRGFL